MIDKIFDKLGEIFYLLPYLLIAAVIVLALVIMIRSVSKNSIKTSAGLISRIVLTLIAFVILVAIWYYFTPENLGEDRYSTWARGIAVVFYLIALPDIWSDSKQQTEE